jgi:protein-tyrosine kinase
MQSELERSNVQSIGHGLQAPRRARDASGLIGTILVREGRLANTDIDRILRACSEHRIRFGDAAVQLGLIKSDDVLFALAQQFDVPVLPRGPNGVSNEVIIGYYPQCPQVEPLRALRGQLMLGWYTESHRRILSIVSPERGEGRSWMVANLATAFAQIGVRTLIIDGDLRHPRQHRLFNLENSAGLCELLTGRCGAEAIVRVPSQQWLYVLGAGALPPDPHELLSRPLFDLIVNRYAEQFDLILIDTPAIADSADAQIVAALGGSALLLARKNHTRSLRLQEARKELSRIGVKIVGSVINEY